MFVPKGEEPKISLRASEILPKSKQKLQKCMQENRT